MFKKNIIIALALIYFHVLVYSFPGEYSDGFYKSIVIENFTNSVSYVRGRKITGSYNENGQNKPIAQMYMDEALNINGIINGQYEYTSEGLVYVGRRNSSNPFAGFAYGLDVDGPGVWNMVEHVPCMRLTFNAISEPFTGDITLLDQNRNKIYIKLYDFKPSELNPTINLFSEPINNIELLSKVKEVKYITFNFNYLNVSTLKFSLKSIEALSVNLDPSSALSDTSSVPSPSVVSNTSSVPSPSVVSNTSSVPSPSVVSNTSSVPSPSVVSNTSSVPSSSALSDTSSVPSPSVVSNTSSVPSSSALFNSPSAPSPIVSHNILSRASSDLSSIKTFSANEIEEIEAVPEPLSTFVLGSGLVGFIRKKRKRFKNLIS